MKKRNLLFLLIPILLVTVFSSTVFAEEDPESDLGIAEPLPIPSLDSYFYQNYDLLPYIESDGHQYIDTGIKGSSNLITNFRISNFDYDSSTYLLGSRVSSGVDQYSIVYTSNNEYVTFLFYSGSYGVRRLFDYYNIYDISFGKDVYVDNNLVHSFSDNFSNNYNIYIFACNQAGNVIGSTSARIYYLSIYDSSLSDPLDSESDPVGYVRYYYPARSKSGNVIGLYDAVSKTFVSTSSATPFSNPVGSPAEMSLSSVITTTLLSGLGWIGQILTFAKSNSVILIFLAIGLAGVAFRWARRVVHF